MALHLGHREKQTATSHIPLRRRTWIPRSWTRRTTVLKRRPGRWRRMRHNPISLAILAAGIAAAAILVLGILLTLGGANPSNTLVHTTLRSGGWLATPFHDLFLRPDPKHQLYLNWGIAAGVYYALARALSWLTRF